MTLVRPELHERFDTMEVQAREEKKERNGSRDAADGVALVIRKRRACDTLYISCQTGQRHYFKMACGSLGIILLPFLCSNWFNFSLSFLKGRNIPSLCRPPGRGVEVSGTETLNSRILW